MTHLRLAFLRGGDWREIGLHASMLLTLSLYVLFLLTLAASAAAFVDRHTLCSYLLSPEVLFAVRLSLSTATVSTLLALLVAVPSAYALSRFRYPGRHLVDTLLDLPVVLPPIALGFLLLAFFQTPPGTAIQQHVLRFVFEVPGIILAQFVVISGLAIRVLKSTFDDLSPRYERVARTLGFNRWQAFWQIELPLARNGLIAGGVLTWARAMGEFGATVIVAGATAMKTEVLSIAIFLKWQTIDIKEGMAITLLLIATSLLGLFVFRRATTRSCESLT